MKTNLFPEYQRPSLKWLEHTASRTCKTCIHWPFGFTGSGYGAITVNGKTMPAHRVMCEMVHGDPPTPDHDAAHSCGKRSCCNHTHIRWATRAENEADKKIHGTATIGEANGRAKISERDARRIRARARSGESAVALAHEYGLHDSTIYRIKTGKRWSEI